MFWGFCLRGVLARGGFLQEGVLAGGFFLPEGGFGRRGVLSGRGVCPVPLLSSSGGGHEESLAIAFEFIL